MKGSTVPLKASLDVVGCCRHCAMNASRTSAANGPPATETASSTERDRNEGFEIEGRSLLAFNRLKVRERTSGLAQLDGVVVHLWLHVAPAVHVLPDERVRDAAQRCKIHVLTFCSSLSLSSVTL